MENPFLQEFLDSNLLLSPAVYFLIENLSFKDAFLSYCLDKTSLDSPIVTCLELQSFFVLNNWNWSSFVKNNFSSLLLEYGFFTSATFNDDNLPINDLDNFLSNLRLSLSDEPIIPISFIDDFYNKKENLSPTFSSNISNGVFSPVPTEEISISSINLEKSEINQFISIYRYNLGSRNQKISISSLLSLYRFRFTYLSTLLKLSSQNIRNRPKNPVSTKDIEINERIYLTGIVTQTSFSNVQLNSAKLQIENFDLDCTIQVSISVQQHNKIPLGVCIAIIGKVIDIDLLVGGRVQLTISAENWFYPGILPPTKKSLPKTSSESWVAVVGAFQIDSLFPPKSFLSAFGKWLQTSHENFRIKYCTFLGGIVTKEEFATHSRSFSDPSSESQFLDFFYESFNKFLGQISSQINVFIVPTITDLTNQFLPQPEIIFTSRLAKDNIFYLQNPNLINLEGKNLLLYNPYQYYSFDPFLNQPEKFAIDLINFRHLAPFWSSDQKVQFPDSIDPLVIPEDIDFFVFHHPSHSIMANFRNINILSIQSNAGPDLDNYSVLIFNLHTNEKKIINF